MSPKVSICIPAYKQIEYLRKTLDSVSEQVYEDYEIVITDDSPDDSIEQLLRNYRFGNKLRYFRNLTRQGSPGNWNKVVQLTSGDYIKLLHHDDWFTSPRSLERYVNLLDKNPKANFAFSGTNVYTVTNNLLLYHRPSFKQLAMLKKEPTCLFMGNFIGAPSATIYRKNGSTFYDKKFMWVVDIDFYIEMLRRNQLFSQTDDPLITTANAAEHQVTEYCKNNKQIQIFEYFSLFEKIEHIISEPRKKFYFLFLLKLVIKHRISSIKEIRDCGYIGQIPSFVEKGLSVSRLSPYLARIWAELSMLLPEEV